MRHRCARVLVSAALLLLVAASEARAQSPWSDQLLESAPEFALTASGVQLDSAGLPHVFVGGDRVYHHWFDGSAWRSEVVDPMPRSGQDLRAAVGPVGEFHLVYKRINKHAESVPQVSFISFDRMHATNRGGAWRVETIGDPAPRDELGPPPVVVISGFETVTGLAVDASGELHLLVFASGLDEEGVSHLWHHGGVWLRERLDLDPAIGVGVSTTDYGAPSQLVLDDLGRAHAIWFASGGRVLVYSVREAAGWRHEPLTTVGGLTLDPAFDPRLLLVDGAGMPHILLNTLGRLVHLTKTGGSWSVNDVTPAAYRMAPALDREGHPHVLVTTRAAVGDATVLTHAIFGAAGWTTEPVSFDAQYSSALALGVDADHGAHAAILVDRSDLKQRRLHYLRGPGAWTALAIADSGAVIFDQEMTSQAPSAQIGADVRVAVVGSQRRLLYRTGSLIGGIVDVRYALEGPSGFSIETLPYVQASYVDARTLAFGIAPDGSEHAAWTNGALIHAVRSGGTWTAHQEAARGHNARKPALAFGADGSSHALYAESATALRHASGPANAWTSSDEVAPLADELIYELPEGVALAAAPLGALHAAWVDQDHVFHATNASGSWIREVVGELPFNVFFGSHALAVESDGTVHVAFERMEPGFYVRHNTGLVYGTNRCPGGFATTDVDPTFLPGIFFRTLGSRYPALVLDQNGNPHISYRYDPDRALRYARIHDGAWTLETVLANTYAGEHSAIALAANGAVSIGHYDHWAGEVGLATREPVPLEPRWDGCPPLPDPGQVLQGSYVLRTPPGALPLYDAGGELEESYDAIHALLFADQLESGKWFAEGSADCDGNASFESRVAGSGKLKGNGRSIKLKRKLVIRNLDPGTLPDAKLKVTRVETVDPVSHGRSVVERLSGKLDGRKIHTRRSFSDTLPSEAFGMDLRLELSSGPRGLVATGYWLTRDRGTVDLKGTGSWSAATQTAELRLRGPKVDIRLSGVRVWRSAGDGIHLRADRVTVKGLGQKVSSDLSSAY